MNYTQNLLALFLGCIVVFSGCATDPKQDAELYVYPPPPDEPRIVYLESYYGTTDFKKRNLFDYMFGRTSLVPIMEKPYSVSVSKEKIYVAVSRSHEVRVIDTKLKKVDYIGRSGPVRLSQPIGVALASDETVYVSDVGQRKILVFDEMGRFKNFIGKQGDLENPAGMAINEDLGRLYVADSKGHDVVVFSLTGELLFRFGKRGGADGEFNFPTNLTIDKKTGSVLVVDTHNFRVQIFDKDGKFISKFGSVGDRPGYFARPRGIAMDSEGHIYVSDAAFGNFQVFDDTFQVLMFLGWAGRGPGEFQTIAGMYIDDQDRIYVADQLNNRIQVFQYLSEKWKRTHPEQYSKYLQTR